jgi:hypothetical protein
MEREQQRQNKRNTVSGFSCTSGAELTPLKSPTGRPGADCDPTPAEPLPLSTVAPPPCPPPLPVPLNLPPGLIINNDLALAFCPSTGGYSVTGTTATSVSAGAQQQVVIFTALENITENQLNYLYEVVPSSSAAIIAAALSGSTSTVISLTHLNYAQSEELIITIQDAKFTVNTLAVEQARNLLICQVENSLQAAFCPTSAYFGPTAAVPSGLLYTPAATAATGTVLVNFALTPTTGSQATFTLINIPSLTAAAAQANSIAFSQAESALRCVYGNAATAAACCAVEAPGNNLGFTYCVPTTGPTIEGSATAVGYFSVEANTVFSAVSLSEANSVARELSRDSLNCYFPSTGITATCVSLGLTAPFAAASTTAIYLEPGSVILYGTTDSVTAANEQASTIAVASLNCFWSNIELTEFCPPSGTFTATDNQLYNLAASPSASLNYSSTVPDNTVISYTSQADANAQARQLALANLSCNYCNAVVSPTCTGGINATVGATSNLICNVLAAVAQNTALSIGNILVSTSEGGINCCYGSSAVSNTIFCGADAYRNNSDVNFTSADNFFLPANIITICESTTAPPPPPLLFSYMGLFATNVAQVGCCSDILLCGGITGSVTALPAIWSYTSNLFDAYPYGATFYSDSSGASAYVFPAGTNYVVSRDVAPRNYRTVTGGTGYTNNLLPCFSCGASAPAYTLKGSTAVNYSSATAAMIDMFCGGPTAQNITLYTASANFLASASYWYTDVCGLSAFTPATGSSATGHYYMGYQSGATGYLLTFDSTGSNEATVLSTYNTDNCPLSKYPYTVYLGATCATGAGATTLYGALPAPDLFASHTGTASFYTGQLNDSTIYSVGATSYINYIAADNTVYSRSIFGVTASAPFTCAAAYKVTVQWSNNSADEVCNYPNFYSPTADGVFNTNIRTLWCNIVNPFVSSATAKFYTSPVANLADEFKPGVSGAVYLSQFTPGDKFRTSYRQYSWSNTNAVLVSYTGTFKESPFIQGSTAIVGPTTGGAVVWLHSATGFYMSTAQVGALPRTKEFLTMPASATCGQPAIYSDIKFALSSQTALNNTYKILPFPPSIDRDIYSSSLLFDGIGYELSSSVNGATSANTITLNDLTKVGAAFNGAIISTSATAINDIGTRPYPTYISNINETSGVVTLGGYYNSISSGFTGRPVHVTGFKIEAGGWTSSGPSFQCYGPNCNKLEVGHSLFSYKISGGASLSTGFVTRITGSTVYYAAAAGRDNFISSFAGTGASDGSGHVYIQGRQFARFWKDDNKQTPILSSLYSNDYNYIWKQSSSTASSTASYTTAKNLVVGNTGGSTAEFVVAGVNYSSLSSNIPRPYSYTGGVEWNYTINTFVIQQYNYSCTGAVSISLIPQFPQDIGYVNSCCEEIQAADTITYGSVAVAACIYYETYESLIMYDEVPQPAYQGTLHYVYINDTYYDVTTHEPVSGNYVIDPNTDNPGNGKFANAMFVDGKLNLSYPCSAKQLWDTSANPVWMRKYIGYFSADPLYPSYPTDDTYPGGFLLDNPTYWSGIGKSNTAFGVNEGFVFKDYEPELAYGDPACNCGNFLHVEQEPGSGVRYSIWSTPSAGWSNCVAGEYYMPQMLSTTAENQPILPFNECATACNSSFSCTTPSDCDGVSPSLLFSPSLSLFSFDISGASLSEDAVNTKAEATEIAQNLVNSFVRCYYFNDFQVGDPCPVPDVLFQQGTAVAGEVISQISKVDADVKAKDLANGRTVCVNPTTITGSTAIIDPIISIVTENILAQGFGAGCTYTVIQSIIEDNDFVEIEIQFNKEECTFTPEVTYQNKLQLEPVVIREINVCTADGQSIAIFVPDFGADEGPFSIPVKF